MERKRKRNVIVCPNCNEEFPLTLSRHAACSEDRYGRPPCRHASLGNCGYMRCPKCDYEWPNPNWPSWMQRKKYEPMF